ncbi:MAG: phosphoenolpyruvate-utilizing N-terminal domain-containing protein, partial [Gammaproteobacteria bacterium]
MMLDTLRRIVQEVSDAKDLGDALQIIVQRVKSAMIVDLCSVYLADHSHRQNVLMATDGLNPDSVGNVRLDFGQGLTGLVGEREEVVNIADSATHPRYQYVPGSGEEQYHAYLGVPIIHHRKLLGVLVVQRHAIEQFDEDNVTFLITIAAQLSGAIAHAEASGISIVEHATVSSAAPVVGQPGSPGVGVGTAFVLYPAADLNAIPDRTIEDIEKEEQIFRVAVEGVRQDIKSLVEKLTGRLPAEDRALFDAYLLMLENEALVGDVVERIHQGNWASGALRDTIREHLRTFEEMDDPYLRERGEDVKDLGRRILVRLQSGGDDGPRNYPRNTVLVGEEITAAMLAEVPITQLAGVVSVTGSRTSHVAILARAMGLAAVMGADLPVTRVDGLSMVVDGYRGRVYISPTKAVLAEFNRLA